MMFSIISIYFLVSNVVGFKISNFRSMSCTCLHMASTTASSSTSNVIAPFELNAGPFLKGWKIVDPSICDDLVSFYQQRKALGSTLKGQISMKGGGMPVINKDIKDSEEISFAPNDQSPEFRRYLSALQTTMLAYLEEYPMAGAYGNFGLVSRTNLQFYPPGGGYKVYHTERTGRGEPEGSRHLVFMTYLNDVTDAGGTEYLHQKVILQPVKGLTVIWPADWTFTHRGVPSPTEAKGIITGWFNYL